MANTQSAKKRVRASLRKRDRNRSTRSAAKTLVARARRPGEGDATLTSDEVRRAISALDKAAEKGILHRNNASRRKGRLMRALAKIAPAAEKAEKKRAAASAPAKAAPLKTAATQKKATAKPAKAKA
jgi:small subunit ribosomal protein S20